MGQALEVIAGRVTAPGAALTALTANTGSSFTVRNTPPNIDIRLISMWSFNNVAGVFRVISPRLHDNVQGIRMQANGAPTPPMIPMRPLQKLYPQDVLAPALSGSAVGGEIELGFLLVYYQDLPGVAARLIDVPSLMNRGVNIVGVEVDLTPGATGDWSGAKALNANFDLLKANTDYAVLGATFSAAAGAIGITSPDTGNLRIPIPAEVAFPFVAEEWFPRLSRDAGIPLIPVLNSANKAGTTIDCATDDEAVAVNVSLILVELAPGGAPSPTARPGGS
jgi:hypothetical protein